MAHAIKAGVLEVDIAELVNSHLPDYHHLHTTPRCTFYQRKYVEPEGAYKGIIFQTNKIMGGCNFVAYIQGPNQPVADRIMEEIEQAVPFKLTDKVPDDYIDACELIDIILTKDINPADN